MDHIRQEIEDFATQAGVDSSALPSEHVFFISAREFEWLMALCKAKKVDLPAMLRDMVNVNRSIETRKFLVEQHIASRFGKVRPPEYVSKSFQKMFDSLIDQVRSSSASK